MTDNKIKVLHFYKTSLLSSNGGVEMFIDTLCNASSKYNIENTLLSLSKTPSITTVDMSGYKLHEAKQDLFIASTGFSISAFAKFKELAEQSDIIHYHFPNPFADILHLICSPNKPSIVTYHSDIIKQKYLLHIYNPLKRKFLNSVNHIVATSPNYFVSSDILQTYSDKVSIIPIGIDHDLYKEADHNLLNYWRSKLKQPFFLFVGAMRYYKGLHVLLEAISGTNIQVVIAGISDIEKELKEYAYYLKLDNVEFLGVIDEKDKVALLHLCYGFVFPSHLRSEAFGISLLEAASVGKPMISCEIGTGTSFVNIANETGLVVNPGVASDLRESMLFFLNNPDIAEKMGENGKKRSYELFTADKMAISYNKLYRSIVK